MKKWGAYKVYLTMEGSLALIFNMIFVASMVYQVTMAELSPLQLVLVGTTLEASVFIFEVPTGVIADVFSRRLSIIIGMFLIGAGFLLEGSFPIFWTIILAQIILGFGYTFTSGATQAWISDEIGEAAAGNAFLRSAQISQLTGLFGIGIGTALGSIQVNLPILLGGLSLMLVGFFLIIVMPETGYTPLSRGERNSWQNMIHTFQQGLQMVSNRPALSTILMIGFIYGLYSEGLDRLWTKHLLDNFTFPAFRDLQPVAWIGGIRVVGMLFSIGATEVARRKIITDRHRQVAQALFLITAVLILAVFTLSLANSLLVALLMFWIITMSRNVIAPVYYAWVNQRLDKGVRATVLSMSSQVDAIGQIVGGPIVGLVGNLVSVRAALALSSFILSPILILFRRAIRIDEGDNLS